MYAPGKLEPTAAAIIMDHIAQVHITELAASQNFAAVLKKIALGEEVIVDRNGHPIAIIKPAVQRPLTVTELIARAKEREQNRGYAITLDEGYAADIDKIVHERKPWTPRSWD